MQNPERYLFFKTGQKLSAQKNGKGRVTVPVFLFFEFYRNWEVRATRPFNLNRASLGPNPFGRCHLRLKT